MAFYKSVIAYDGTDFAGFQRQGPGRRTIQLELERALQKVGWEESSLLAAGRTDAGVHARGQVIAFRLEWNHPEDTLTRAINAHLPADLVVRRTLAAPEGFHPRFSASSRRYRYRLLFDPVRQPLEERFAWRVWPLPDVRKMREAADRLVGEHDFGGFGQAPIDGGHTRRRMLSTSLTVGENQGYLEFAADAFLYRMVRRLTAGLLAIGWGKRDLEEWETTLQDPTQKWAGRIAPAAGLCLESVQYEA